MFFFVAYYCHMPQHPHHIHEQQAKTMLGDYAYSPMPAGRVRWLYIDFNSFFASVEQQLNPKLRGKPLIVLPLMTDSTCAIAASYEAKAFGIKTGTPVWEAKQRCPGLLLVPAQHQHYVEFHQRIIEVVEDCHPVTAICSIDEIACHLGGRDQIPEEAIKLSRAIKAALAKKIGPYVRCSIGLASNRFLAKVAGDMQKPDGLTLLLPENLPGPLLKLAPMDLPGISHNMNMRLLFSGIGSMKDLWALTPKHMRAIWRSVEGERFYAMLHGYDIPDRETKRSSIGHSRVLEPSLRVPEAAYEVTRKLLMKAATRLRREGFAASMLGFGVRFGHPNGPQNRDDGIRGWSDARRFNHSEDTFLFLKTLDDMWSLMLAKIRQCGIRHIIIKKTSVTLWDLLPQKEVTGDLFATPVKRPSIRTKESLSAALDTLQRRYGKDMVTIGWKSKALDQFGTKIAFTRVPEMEEFDEG